MLYNFPTNQTGWRLLSEPTDTILDLEAAKRHLRIDFNHEDDDIEFLIQVATQYVESKGEILTPQSWEFVLDRFPYFSMLPYLSSYFSGSSDHPITLFKRPLQSVDYITYVDENGATQTWDAAKYQVAKTSGNWPRVLPVDGEVWPSTRRRQMEAVRIGCSLGYNSSPQSVPTTLIAAMKLLIGHLYENREGVVVVQGIVSLELPLGVEALIDNAIGTARVY